MSMRTATASESPQKHTEDRLLVREAGDRILMVVADGAGGRSGGAEAADRTIQILRGCDLSEDPVFWVMRLSEIDRSLAQSGETTAVVAVITPQLIVGASVGDSGAWLVQRDKVALLTANQKRKPLVGSGAAIPTLFCCEGTGGTLLLATDGLLKYTSQDKICGVLRSQALERAPKALIDLVRLKSGTLQDDVAIAICSREP